MEKSTPGVSFRPSAHISIFPLKVLMSMAKGWQMTSSTPAFPNSFRRNFPALFAPPLA